MMQLGDFFDFETLKVYNSSSYNKRKLRGVLAYAQV